MYNIKNIFLTILKSIFRISTPIFFGVISVTIGFLLLQSTSIDAFNPFVLIILEHGLIGATIVSFLYFSTKWDAYPFDDFNIIHWRKHNIKDAIPIFVLVLVLLLLNSGLGIVYNFIGVELSNNILIEQVQSNPVEILYLIPFMLIFVGPVEEIILRGLVQGVLRDNMNVNLAIFVTSLLFGLLHIPAAGGISMGAFAYVITTGSLSLLLGYIYEKEKTILIPTLAHGVYNSVLLIMTYIALTNGVEIII